MKITFQCGCGKTLKAEAEHAGSKARCPRCAALMTIPGSRVTVSQKDSTSGEMWRLKELRTLASEDDPPDYRFSCLSISPTGKIAVTGSRVPGGNGQALRFWNLPEGNEMEELGEECEAVLDDVRHVQALAFSADGRRLACASSGVGGKRILVFQVGDRLGEHAFEAADELLVDGEVHALCFSRDGRFLACGGKEGIWVWGVKSGKQYHRIETPVKSLVFSPDRNYLLGGERGQADAEWCDLLLWDMKTGKIERRYRGHTDWVNAVAFSPDGKLILSGSGGDPELQKNEYSVRLWESSGKSMTRYYDGYIGRIGTLGFTADGRHFVAAGLEYRERFYKSASELIDGKAPYERWLFAHVRRVLDGKVLARFENKEKSRCAAPGEPRSYAFAVSPSGRLLLIAPEKPELHLYKAVQ